MGIDKFKDLPARSELRRLAEEQLNRQALGMPLANDEPNRLIHELHVHQIELEMQNEELREARDEMESALEKYTDLYDFAPVGYLTLDRDGVIKAVNLRGADLLGVERSRLLGRRYRAFLPVEACILFSEFLGKVFASRSKESCELAVTGKENQPLFVQIEAMSDASGKECRIAVIDITERRRAEDALIEKKREIEEINRSLEERIAKAVDELRQKDQILILSYRQAIMGEMINNIAHQWRQPLNTLGLVIQQVPLYHRSGELSADFLNENTAKGMELIQHMSRTIDDFRNFFRSDKEAVAFSVNQVIARTLSLIEGSFKEPKIDIVLHPEGDPMVNGYPNEYSQVVMNILMNAHDALIEHNVDDARISIRVFAERGRTVVTITDNANGIADENLGRLFDPYFTTKGPDKGTGIGLYMSKTIIEKNMGGRLLVRNTGGGAEFRIEV